MSEIRQDLIDTIDKLCEDVASRELRAAADGGEWPAMLWRALEDVGLVRSLLPEAAGGAGLGFADAMAALRRTAAYALPVPLAETMVAGRLLMAAGLQVPDGPLTIAPVQHTDRLTLSADGRLSGKARRVPWGQTCEHVVVVASAPGEERVALLAPPAPQKIEHNLAREPRVTLQFDHQPVACSAPLPDACERLWLEGALVRSVQMTGALERILSYSLHYANERVQFGKPIAKFQAIQHMLAVLAGHVAASSAVTDAAIEASVQAPNAFSIAVAKSRVGEAAGKGAEIGHQVHGAMGYTREHVLHYSTRRLWAWREEFGNESHWQVRIGRQAAARGADALWPMLTAL